ncbi:MAG TPA: histidine phosphatase family protein [Candidatus Dormibacteraeota bacterium]|nr:histidine phosphatase family protein [Candidatus Dormibacteraeota bacterium]
MATGAEYLIRAMQSLESIFLLGVEGVTEVWLVRHADSYRGVAETVDPPLSTTGREQASRLADRIRRTDHAAVYSSPLKRAVETARAISDDFTLDGRLVEVKLEISDDGTLDFKETSESAVTRMRAALEDMVRAHPGERVIAITHAAAIVACLSDVMGLEAGQLRVLPYYTSINKVRVLGDRRVVGSLGDVAHLE